MKQSLLVHTVKTLRYRLENVLKDTDESFGGLKIAAHTRTPLAILNHMADLTSKAIHVIQFGNFDVNSIEILSYEEEKKRLLAGLDALQKILMKQELEIGFAQQLLQGPLLDMVTHVGQLALLRGVYGQPVLKQSYFNARIE